MPFNQKSTTTGENSTSTRNSFDHPPREHLGGRRTLFVKWWQAIFPPSKNSFAQTALRTTSPKVPASGHLRHGQIAA